VTLNEHPQLVLKECPNCDGAMGVATNGKTYVDKCHDCGYIFDVHQEEYKP